MSRFESKKALYLKVVCAALLVSWSAFVLTNEKHDLVPPQIDESMAPLNGDINTDPSAAIDAAVEMPLPEDQTQHQKEQLQGQSKDQSSPEEQKSNSANTETQSANADVPSLQNEIQSKDSARTVGIESNQPKSDSAVEASAPSADQKKQEPAAPARKTDKSKQTQLARAEKKVSTWNNRDEYIDGELLDDPNETLYEGRRAAFQRGFDTETY